MSFLDWMVLGSTLLAIVFYGVYKTYRESRQPEFYIRGDRNTGWWTIGISVMATQASAVTFLSTPGQAFYDGIGFVQFYLGTPLALIIICLAFIPIYHRLNIYTAYEFLQQRFDVRVRIFTAILFLIQRGLAAGITIFAPSIVMSVVLGIPLRLLNFLVGLLVIIYTVLGGTKAVNVTQKQQMLVIMLGMSVIFFLLWHDLAPKMDFSQIIQAAATNKKLNAVDFSIDFKSRYTVWSGLTGGLFLALSYFGTDQSQVQRYLSGKSLKEKQLGLIFNGFLKIPMQFFILFIGVMVFVFCQQEKAPLNFNPEAEKAVLASPYRAEYQKLQADYDRLFSERKLLTSDSLSAMNNRSEMRLRDAAKALIAKASDAVEANDKDYVFIYYVLNRLPAGLIGLLIAVIICAAMSSTSSELNALGATTAMDIYKTLNKERKPPEHYLKSARWFTLLWGGLAILFANFITLAENLIQLVNIVGSVFYGNVLGIFLIAFFLKKIEGRSVFMAALVTQLFIFALFFFLILGKDEPLIGYLWLNVIGCLSVMILSVLLEILIGKRLNRKAVRG